MSFMGKILIVVQVLLSVVFMAFAGAVNTAHVNWRRESLKLQEQVRKTQTELTDERADREKERAEKAAQMAELERVAGEAKAENTGLKQQVTSLNQEKKDLAVAAATANEQAQISGEEAQARRAESVSLREINTRLLASRDTEIREKQKLQDELNSLKLDFAAAQGKNRELLGKVASRDRKLAELGVAADDLALNANINLPPQVEGKVLNRQRQKSAGASELVEISLGSDDGLVKGHHLYVYRSGLVSGQRPKYLGRIRIVSTTPDRSVAAVVEQDRSGPIEEGDNVTTKF